MSTLSQLKASSEARLAEEKRQVDRRRNLITLIARHLMDAGYSESAERVQAESGVSLTRVDVADNIDLLYILSEFEEYYEMKLGRKPVLTRRIGREDGAATPPAGPTTGSKPGLSRPAPRATKSSSSLPPASSSSGGSESPTPDTPTSSTAAGMGIAGKQVKMAPSGSSASLSGGGAATVVQNDDYYAERLLKPIPSFSTNPEMRELAAIVSRDIYQHNPNVRWDDVVELHDAKRLLKEAVVMPIKYPQIFTGLLSPWRGVLLFGPPGTGKTMLARAVATECRTTFFNISASTIVSKWRGDSEKLIRVLFELARYHAPSTIFLDELDSIMSQRGSEGASEHEASRRMKTEILIQMDGLAKTNDLVFVLAASNLPWELDLAMLRRLEKRVYVPLPGPVARELMVRKKLCPALPSGSPPTLIPHAAPDVDFPDIARQLEGYSGSDIALLCKEAAMRPVRRLMSRLEALEATAKDGVVSSDLIKLDAVDAADVRAALEVTKPSARLVATKYEAWQAEFASS